MGAAATDTDEGVKVMTVIVIADQLGHIELFTAHRHLCGLSRLVPKIVPPSVRMEESMARSRAVAGFP
ncbi:MAG: hypothetical protein JKP90_23185 [Desulfofustis sp. PB-SRB1]|nr:hypothetical protein [Desulfofustis sp. PB-SRB1]